MRAVAGDARGWEARGRSDLSSGQEGQGPRRAAAARDATRAKAREVGHWCEALAHAQPSPFLPLYIPRQKKGHPSAAGRPPQPDSAAPRPPRSFFRRPLGDMTVAFSSERGRAILRDVVGKADGGSVFLDLMTAFEMQRHPVSCGMASLVIALNALKLAPWRKEAPSPAGAGVSEEGFDMVTEDEITRVLLKEGEKGSLDSDGVSLQTLAHVALRVRGIDVQCQHAEGGTGGGFSQADFRRVSALTFAACSRCELS